MRTTLLVSGTPITVAARAASAPAESARICVLACAGAASKCIHAARASITNNLRSGRVFMAAVVLAVSLKMKNVLEYYKKPALLQSKNHSRGAILSKKKGQ